MGIKTILFLGVIASTTYIYFAVNNNELTKANNTAIQKDITKLNEVDKKEENIINKDERLSIPAFGFIVIEESKQIAAVMSDEDANGELAKYIDLLCEKEECIKDIKYSNDTKSANWQKEVVNIIKLFNDGSIDNGSIFIDGNTLKVTGVIHSQLTKESLKQIFKDAKIDIKDQTVFATQTTVTEKITPKQTDRENKPKKQNSMIDADARVRAILEEFRKNK